MSARAGQQQQRRLPPFGHELIAALRDPARFPRYVGTSADGRNPTLWLACGPGAWDWAKRNQGKRLLTIAPPGENPAVYDWHLLRNHDPIFVVALGKVSQHEIRALIAAIMHDGVRRAVVGAHDAVTVYRRKEATHGTP